MYIFKFSVFSSVFKFISLVKVKFLFEHFIGQYDILIYDLESTVKSREEVPNTSPGFIGSKFLNEMLPRKKIVEKERGYKEK